MPRRMLIFPMKALSPLVGETETDTIYSGKGDGIQIFQLSPSGVSRLVVDGIPRYWLASARLCPEVVCALCWDVWGLKGDWKSLHLHVDVVIVARSSNSRWYYQYQLLLGSFLHRRQRMKAIHFINWLLMFKVLEYKTTHILTIWYII